jgi:acetylornithine/N-succinyldiaminopimelate aminotransferase
MEKQEYIAAAEQELLHTYNRFPLVLDHGEGVYLYDTDGKEYLDFAAGIAVSALGYSNKDYADALKGQIDKLLHTSNLYYSTSTIEAAGKALAASGMDRIFFTNSGTEAIEGAIKAAKKYAYTRDGHAGHEIIAMQHSFHGRSIGALSVTGNAHYQEPFAPLMPGVSFAEYNNLDSVKALVTDKTCAIIMETVQGEGGIYPADPAFLEGVRALCDEHDILLILDEIQCGMGRTGAMFAWQHYGVKPDIMTCAKALGCGVPVGAFFMTQKVADKSLAPGDHGTTYGGNPFVGAAVSVVFDIFEKEQIVAHVNEVAPYLEQKLDELVAKYDFLTARRGMGLMQGVVCTLPVGKVAAQAIEEGLLVITAGADVLRFVPPLVIGEKEVDAMLPKLEAALLAVAQKES